MKSILYFFNPVSLLKLILSSSVRAKMHVGMGDPIFPSDFLYYRCNIDCFCSRAKRYHPDRVFTIGRHNEDASLPNSANVIIISLNAKGYPMSFQSQVQELMLSEERLHIAQVQVLSRKSHIHFDYRYEGPQDQSTKASTYTSPIIFRNF